MQTRLRGREVTLTVWCTLQVSGCHAPRLKSVVLTHPKLQALVHILPSTTAVFSYTIGSRKLSANEQFFFFFVGAQTVVSLLQTTQIKQDVSFIAANIVYTSTLSFYPGGCVSCLRACFGARLLLQSY